MNAQKFKLGDSVCNVLPKSFTGTVVGVFRKENTYAVESEGSVQIYPAAALEAAPVAQAKSVASGIDAQLPEFWRGVCNDFLGPPSFSRTSFDGVAFYQTLKRAVKSRGKKWKDVSAETGVSQTTLSRMRSGRRPDAASLAALSAWAGINPARFCAAAPVAPTSGASYTDCRSAEGITVGLIDTIINSARLLAGRDLSSPASAAALADLRSDADVAALASRPVGDGGAETTSAQIEAAIEAWFTTDAESFEDRMRAAIDAARTAGTDTAGGVTQPAAERGE